MELSGSTAYVSDPPNYGWARVFGTAIAILTLTVPTLAIAYYSSSSISDSALPNPYSLRTLEP